jgi:hypothetical protein
MSGAAARAMTAHSFEVRARRVCRLRHEASREGNDRVNEATSVWERSIVSFSFSRSFSR